MVSLWSKSGCLLCLIRLLSHTSCAQHATHVIWNTNLKPVKENRTSLCVYVTQSCTQLSNFAIGNLLVLLHERKTKTKRHDMSCDLQATTAGMLKGTKLLIDTDHIALVRLLWCKGKDGETKYRRIKVALNFDRTASDMISKGSFLGGFLTWNSLSVSYVTLDSACVIISTAHIFLLIHQASFFSIQYKLEVSRPVLRLC